MIDITSTTWIELTRELARMIESEREKLESDLDATGTTRCRARIRAFKDVLNLADAANFTPEPEIFHE